MSSAHIRLLSGIAILSLLAACGETKSTIKEALEEPAPTSQSVNVPASELTTLRDHLKSIENGKEPTCPAFNSERSTFVFVFEGAEGYCPRYAHMNLARDERGVTLMSKLEDTVETGENRPVLKEIRDLLNAEEQAKNCTLALNVTRTLDETSTSTHKHEIVYYSKKGYEDAIACWTAQNRPEMKTKVFSFSQGGFAALKFSQALEGKGASIDHVFTVDPVAQELRWVNGVILTEDDPIFQRTPNVVRWSNVFQKYDTKSLWDTGYIDLGARGSRVFGADENIEITQADHSGEWEKEHGHTGIHRAEATKKILREIFEN